jgi:deoxyhypusine synthase
MKKRELLQEEIRHIDIKGFDSRPLIEQFKRMSFQARNLAKAAEIYDAMISDRDCTIIMCLAGSLFSAGLKRVVYDLIEHNMVDTIVSSGAIMVDQDFFEALGFRHYKGTPYVNDEALMRMGIDRIYDTFIDENELRVCDTTIKKLADSLPKKPYSSREFIQQMGRYLEERNIGGDSVVRLAYEKNVPIFVPAFSDCSAGFGLIYHQFRRENRPKVSIDSVRDFLELTKIKIASKETGLFVVGGGVPKNFAQDTTVAADILKKEVPMHKYAIQITLADERDGGLSGSTLREAHSWAKVDKEFEQMVFSEATIALPLIASYAYHKGNWRNRSPKNLTEILKCAL